VIQILQRLTVSVEAASFQLEKTFNLVFPNIPVNVSAKIVSIL